MRLGQIRPHYQPIVELLSGQITGFEALARWHHPTRGCLLPKSFLKIAEDCRSKGFLHVTSHVSDPLPAKVALAVLDVIEEEDLNKRAIEMGKHLQDGLRSLQQRR